MGEEIALGYLGVEQTVKCVTDGLKEISEKNDKLYSVFLSMCPRPRDGQWFEKARCEVNSQVRAEIIRMSREEGKRVIFINMDPKLRNNSLFARDRVHLNYEGNKVLGSMMMSVLDTRARKAIGKRTRD